MEALDQIGISEAQRSASSEPMDGSVETLTNATTSINATANGSNKTTDINEQVNVYAENLEHKVDEIYQVLEKNTTNSWKSFNGFLTNFQKNLPEYVNHTRDKLEKLSVQEEKNADVEQKKQTILDNLKNGNFSKEEAAKYLDQLKNSTNNYLDELDNDLQEVEKLVGGFASKMGSRLGSLLKDVIPTETTGTPLQRAKTNEEDDGDEDEEIGEHETNVLFNVPNSKVFGTRQEQRLHDLHNSEDLYVKDISSSSNFNTFKASFDSSKYDHDEVLKTNKDLSVLYNKIVPAKLTAEDFWLKYAYNKQLIELEESTRAKLLSERKKTQDNDEEDNFNWDDDEEDETSAKAADTSKDQKTSDSSRTSSDETYDLQSTNSSTLDIVASKRKAEDKAASEGSATQKAEQGEEEEEEDDWE